MKHRLLATGVATATIGLGLLTPTALSAQPARSAQSSASMGVASGVPSVPAKRNKYRICDRWDGIWSLTISDGQGGTSHGRMDVRVYHHDRAVGDYTGSTSGKLKGDLVDGDGDQKVCGKHWEGKFKDLSGQYQNKGKFTAQLYKDNGNWYFFGEYKPCKFLCSWNDWGGAFLSED